MNAPNRHPADTAPISLGQLRRLRWAVRAVLALGVAASVAANMLHAPPSGISRAIAAWPPLALLLTVELISRVPVHQRLLAVLRLAATATIASIAAWVSYWHMTAVAARHGETAAGAAHLLPISVDGLVIVASISLVEIAGRIRAAGHPARDPAKGGAGAPEISRPDRPARTPRTAAAPVRDGADPARQVEGTPASHRGQVRASRTPTRRSERRSGHETGAPRDTPAAVAYWYHRDPHMHPAAIAARIGRSERTVRRYWPPTTQQTVPIPSPPNAQLPHS